MPTPTQDLILGSEARNILVAGGVRAGKSRTAAMFLLMRVLEHLATDVRDSKKTASGAEYWLVAADYDRTRAEFDYLADSLLKLFGRKRVYASKRIDPGYITIAGLERTDKPILIKTKSAVDYRRLAMVAPWGIVACESSQLDQESYWRLAERLAEHRGWLMLAGTFENSLGWYPTLFTRWQNEANQKIESAISYSLPSWSNTIVFPGGREDPEIKKLEAEHSPDWFNERIAGVPAPPSGLVHPSFQVDVHVRFVKYRPGDPVYLAIDPGYSRATDSAYAVECCQIHNGQVRIFDEVFERGLTAPDIITGILMKRPWWGLSPKSGVIDISGTAHAGAQESNTETWLRLAGLALASQSVKIIAGIERMNVALKYDPITREPGLVIDPACKGIISEFGGCPNPFDGATKVYKWQTSREGSIVGESPRDRYNHGIKALTYFLVHHFGYARADVDLREIRVRHWGEKPVGTF